MFGQCTSSPMMLEHTILHPSMVTPGHFVVVLQENLSLFKKELCYRRAALRSGAKKSQ